MMGGANNNGNITNVMKDLKTHIDKYPKLFVRWYTKTASS